MWKKSTNTATIEMTGGMDLSSSEMAIHPGRMRACQGWEIDTERGYKSALGYERYDGQTAPSEATFTRLIGTHSGLTGGETITGGISSATGQVIGYNDDAVFVIVLSGTFEVETATDGIGGTIDIVDIDNIADTETELSTYTKAASDYARTQIGAVPGEGPIRGVWSYKGVVYAFRDKSGGSTCGMYKSTASGWATVTTPTLSAGGTYRFTNYNFTGSSGTLKMYGCDGVNPGFEFDGTTFTQIATGMTADTPTHVIGHANHLFFVFTGGSLQHSSIADPHTWTALTGAAELSVGDEITNLVTTPGGVMVIFCRNTIKALYGTSAADWQIKTISDNYGAITDTVQNTICPVYVGDGGISLLTTTDAFGDFESDPVSEPIQKLISSYKDAITTSVTFRHKNQYRLCFDTGEILVLSLSGQAIKGYTMLSYPIPIRCISSSLRSDRYLIGSVIEKDYVFFGSDDGYIYQMDAGQSFDGEQMYSFFQLPPFTGGYYQRSDGSAGINSEAANKRKTFMEIMVEAESESGAPVQFYFKPDFGFRQPNAPEGYHSAIATEISGGKWNLANWNEFYWTASGADAYYNGRLDGTGPGVSLTFGISTTNQESITIKSVMIKYRFRR